MTGPGPDTLGRLLAKACRRYGDRVAITAKGQQRSYRQLLENGSRIANAIAGLGLDPGQKVAAMLEDRVDAMEIYVACALGGFPIVHVNDRLTAREVDYVLSDSGASVLFHTDGRNEVVSALSGRSDLAAVVTIGGDPASSGAGERPDGALDHDAFRAGGSSALPTPTVAPEDLAILGYTSGTTGFPKGAMASNRAVVNCVRLIPFAYRLPMYGRCAFTGTLSFVSGIWGVILPHLYLGGTVNFLAPYTIDSWVDHIISDRSTFTYAPSPLVPGFVAEVSRRREALDSLEAVLHSASPLPRSHCVQLTDLIGERFVEVWGMTETVAPLTVTAREDWRGTCAADDIYSSVGRPLANAGIRVADRDGNTLPIGETGELVVEADTMFSGYYANPAKTAEVLRNGEYFTGDVGRIDAAGYVYVTDRLKDMIISGGMNVYPAELEAVLATLDGVAESAVFGVPDERWGETVVAAVVRRAGAVRVIDEDAVLGHLRANLASYKKPSRVVFVDALPRNVAMKVQKDTLRKQFGAGS